MLRVYSAHIVAWRNERESPVGSIQEFRNAFIESPDRAPQSQHGREFTHGYLHLQTAAAATSRQGHNHSMWNRGNFDILMNLEVVYDKVVAPE